MPLKTLTLARVPAFLTAGCLVATALGCASTRSAAPPPGDHDPGAAAPVVAAPRFPDNVGVQLYSLRNQLGQDLPGTLAKVREMTFVDVELYSLHGQSPAALKTALEAVGLRAVSMHQPFERFEKDLPGLIADAKALGVTFVGCAWIPHQPPFTAARNREAIEVFNRAGAALQKEGLRMFYHPHGYEFAPAEGGGTLFDEMLARTQAGVVDFEMDVFWFVHGGADPKAYLRKAPERFVLTHLKDMKHEEPTGLHTGKADKESDVTLGAGKIDIAGIVREAEAAGKVLWHFLEDESTRSMDQLPASLTYVKGIRVR